MSSARARHALARRNVATLAFTCFALVSVLAHAGHAPLVPEPRTILLRDGAPNEAVIGTRRGGYFMTRDGGETWSWLCEAGIGYDDEEVYPGLFLGSGELVVSTGFGGIARSPDGCGWSHWLPSEQPFIADVQHFPNEAASVLALEARPDGAGFVNQLWLSRDGAESWQTLGAPFAPATQAGSLRVTGDGEIYVTTSGVNGGELHRMSEAASDWRSTLLAPEAGAVPRLIGVAGSGTEARVYVRVDYPQLEGVTAVGDRVLVSRSGGDSFTLLLQANGDLAAGALSPDGERLAVGGHSDGLHLLRDASSETSTLERVSSRSVHALAWDTLGKLYVAGHEAADGFAVGVSSDEGATFQPFLALCQVAGPLACDASTSVGAACLSTGETGWDVRREVAAPEACENPSAPDATGDEEATPPGETTEAERPRSSGGGCTTPSGSLPTGGSSLLGALAALGLCRCRNRRRSCRATTEHF